MGYNSAEAIYGAWKTITPVLMALPYKTNPPLCVDSTTTAEKFPPTAFGVETEGLVLICVLNEIVPPKVAFAMV